MNGVSRFRWLIVALWLATASFSLFALPDLQSIVRKTEQKFLPSDAESVQATQLMQRINPSVRALSNAVIVVSREKGLRDADLRWIEQLLELLESKKTELHISSVLSAQSHPELAERLTSEDGTTRLAVVSMPEADFEDATKVTLNELKGLLKSVPQGVSAVLTGSAPLSQDFQQTSETGLRRTELLTIGLVILILLFVFRSPITPIIPLFTIGTSFVISRGLIGMSAGFGVPVSHFTESFLIAVLFGAGTDYCILIVQRYREELRTGTDGNRLAAMTRMMKGVTPTIVFSASTVFAAFLLIGFADFGLYRSAVGVAIGMLVTVLAALTLAPAMLLVFGKACFWPLRQSNSSERESPKLWARLASLTSRRSAIILLSTFIILAPLTLLFQGKRSFDDISEINPELGSVVGFRLVERTFSPGEVFPVTMVVTSTASMRTTSGLAALEQASSDLTRVDNVGEVRSAVRPLGRKPEQLTIPGQLRKPNVEDLIESMIKDQRLMIEGLQTLASSAAPLSQGLIGIVPAIRQLENGFSKLIASQLGGIGRVTGSNENAGRGPGSIDSVSGANEQALDYYISPDGLTTKIEVILESNPYSDSSINSIPVISERLRDSLASTAIADPSVFVTGVSAKYYELRGISYRDFVYTGLLVLAGITLVLMLLLRSVIAPLYVLLSLGFNYWITMGILEFAFVKVLGYPGLSWTVSFFIFLIIVALGVDYAIFLMARFKEEYRPGGVVEAMSTAMRKTGGVIGSAALIMAGAFGALGFSGMDTLVQIGIGTLIGLLLYAVLFIALVVPSFAFLLGESNWWPFRKQADKK